MFKYIVVILLLFPVTIFSQDVLSKEDMTDFFQQFKRNSLRQITTMNWFQVDTFGIITAQYGNVKGDFHRSQDAPERRDLNFFSEGLKKVNSIRFYGSFNFEYFRADSVGNTMQYTYSDEIPYYFYAFRKGSWGGLKYDFKGMADWEINSKFHLMAGLNYKAENKWRTIDPRPEIFDQHQEYTAALEYRFLPKHSISAGATVIAKNLETTVGYMNKDLTDRFSDTIYINHMMYGYGYGLYWTTARNLYRTSRGNNFQAAYSYLGRKWQLYLNANIQSEKEDVTQRLTESELLENSWFGIVYYDKLYLNAFLNYKINQHVLYSKLSYESLQIRDNNKKLFIDNYTNDKNSYGILIGDLIHRNNKPSWEVNLHARYQDWFRKDAAMGVYHQYDHASFNITAGKFLYQKNENYFHIKLTGGYTKPTNSLLNLGSIQNSFIDRVVKYDYYYNNATVTDAAFSIQYHFPIENLTTFAGFTGRMQWAKMPEGNILPRSYPGLSRTLFQIRFGVFL
ncbi:DUF6850 family outer membrane beta-barrel protein [Gynurincola endophyticus]|uniref:DUF6850 family outer membrane beta-barrel protein n=1 Tax=Gynurincola endophyticus TaxID=2479004 RepID=UPI000F8F2A7D|nr:DUF6850 family outer membrane beta-barrel protein [Gynurincola endophyticus]